jgi:hypothetical protein
MYDVWRTVNKNNASKLIIDNYGDIEAMAVDVGQMDWIDKEDRGIVVDFACGVGRNTLYLASICDEVYGFDFPNMLEMLKTRPNYKEHSNITLFDDWQALSAKGYDTVYCCIALQHLCSKDLLYYAEEFSKHARSLYVHGRDFNDHDNEKIFDLLSNYWKVDKICGPYTAEQLSNLPRDTHYYVKWVVK